MITTSTATTVITTGVQINSARSTNRPLLNWRPSTSLTAASRCFRDRRPARLSRRFMRGMIPPPHLFLFRRAGIPARTVLVPSRGLLAHIAQWAGMPTRRAGPDVAWASLVLLSQFPKKSGSQSKGVYEWIRLRLVNRHMSSRAEAVLGRSRRIWSGRRDGGG